MHAKFSIRVLFAIALALSPFVLAACDSQQAEPSTPTKGASPELLQNYPSPANKAAK